MTKFKAECCNGLLVPFAQGMLRLPLRILRGKTYKVAGGLNFPSFRQVMVYGGTELPRPHSPCCDHLAWPIISRTHLTGNSNMVIFEPGYAGRNLNRLRLWFSRKHPLEARSTEQWFGGRNFSNGTCFSLIYYRGNTVRTVVCPSRVG